MTKPILFLISCITIFASSPAFCMWGKANQGDDWDGGRKSKKRSTRNPQQEAYKKQKRILNDQDFMEEALSEERGPIGFEYYNLSQLCMTKLSPSFIEENQGIIRGFVDVLTPRPADLFNKKEVANCVPMDPKKVQLIESNRTSYPPHSYAWCNIPKPGRYYIENFRSPDSKIGVKVMLSSSNPPIHLNFYDLLVREKTSQTQIVSFHIDASSYSLQAYVVPDPDVTRDITVQLGVRSHTVPKQQNPTETATFHLAAETRVVRVPGQKIIFVIKDGPR
jgi:hypothetical protein